MVRYYKKQRYAKLRKAHQQSGTLFSDPEFPASSSSLYLPGKEPARLVEWKRPRELVDNPKLVVDGVSGNDLNQGKVGNCWFVAACGTLAGVPTLWNKVVVNYQDQDWNDEHPEKYAGIFRFHFWRMGSWVEVVIDDRLPTMNGQLIYVHSKSPNEFWSALLEKAYAKLAGSYEALEAGHTGDALVDFSGGVSKRINLRDYHGDEQKQKELFQMMQTEMDRKAMLSCSIKADSGEREARLDTGLIKGHAYGISAVKKVKVSEGFFSNKKFRLVRIRNPWGEKEWNGAWSDGSDEWRKVSASERKRLGITFEDDGEFWMSFSDWLTHYTDATIARLINTSVLTVRKTWHESRFFGNWGGRTAGGCINNETTFFNNPQYLFRIPNEESGMVIVDLMQEDHRHEGREDLSIGFQIFRVEENRRHRLKGVMESAGKTTFINSRSIYSEFTLSEGHFVIVPSTFEAGKVCRFLLRVFTEQAARSRELARERLRVPWWRCCTSQYRAIVRLTLHSASGLAKQDLMGEGADPYCYVICEGQKARTPVQKNTLTPVFNAKLIFFIKRPEHPLKVEVWNHNAIKDRFMGQALVTVTPDQQARQKTYPLHERGAPERLTQGELSLTAVGTTEMMSM